MKKTIGSAILAGTLSISNISEANNADLIYLDNNAEITVCNSDEVIQDSKYRVFALIEGWETGKNKLTYCKYGEKIFEFDTATGRPHYDGGVYTPEGDFMAGALIKDKKSNSYKGKNGEPAKMPNAIHVYSGIWIHAGTVKNKAGKILKFPSHGCVRLGYGDSKQLYDQIEADKYYGEKVEVFIRGTNPRTK